MVTVKSWTQPRWLEHVADRKAPVWCHSSKKGFSVKHEALQLKPTTSDWISMEYGGALCWGAASSGMMQVKFTSGHGRTVMGLQWRPLSRSTFQGSTLCRDPSLNGLCSAG